MEINVVFIIKLHVSLILSTFSQCLLQMRSHEMDTFTILLPFLINNDLL